MIFAFGNSIKTSAETGSKEVIHEHQQSDSPAPLLGSDIITLHLQENGRSIVSQDRKVLYSPKEKY